MARTTPAHSGYKIQNGVGTGENGKRIDVWVEYYIGAYNIETNTTPFKAYFYAALNPSYSSNTSYDSGLYSTFSVDGSVVSTIKSGAYDFRSSSILNLLGSYSGDVAHNSDGTRQIKISGSFTTNSSYITGGNVEEFTITLPTIPRASGIDGASNVTLGNNCSVLFTPKAASMRFKLVFSCGSWSATSNLIHPNTMSRYTYTGMALPLEVARQFDDDSATMKVVLYTYSDSAGKNQIGVDEAQFTVYVPDNSSTKPVVSVTLTPGTTPISGLYIKGLSTVKVDISAEDPYGASIDGYSVTIGGTSYGHPYTSEYLNTVGAVKVIGYATNSRGFTGSKESSIEVIEYSRPQLQNVSAVRCTQDGNPSENGTYLKISATRKYSKVMSGGKQNNFCQIRFRYMAETDSSWSGWTTILGEDANTDTVTTGSLLGNLSPEKVYLVQVNAIDTLGYPANATLNILNKSVFMHRRAGGKAMGLGKKVERDNLLDVAWDATFRGTVTVGTPVNDTDAVNKAYVDALLTNLTAKLGL
jgi:hypothetical protein